MWLWALKKIMFKMPNFLIKFQGVLKNVRFKATLINYT